MKCTTHFKPLGLLFLFCLIPFWVSAQIISVSGIVKDVAGEPIIGAGILQKGTSNGTITDFDGRFTLKVPSQS